MTDSPNTTLLSRRALMSVSVGLVSANVAAAAIAVRAAQAMAPAASVDAAADAELVQMCQRWIRMCRVYEHACSRQDLAKRGSVKDRLGAVVEQLSDKVGTLADDIAETPAASWRGVGAKAEVLASDLSVQDSGDPCDFYDWLYPVLVSLLNDACRLSGSAVVITAHQVEV